MKEKFLFIGTHCEFLGLKLKTLGQPVQLTAAEYEQAKQDEVFFLPESEFGKFFSAEDVKQFGNPAGRLKAPGEFFGRWNQALDRSRELHGTAVGFGLASTVSPELAEVMRSNSQALVTPAAPEQE